MSSGFINFMRTMRNDFDLRYTIPVFINLLRSQSSEALPWDWESPFHTFNNNPHQTSLAKLCFPFVLFLLFSVTSMNIPINPPSPNNNAIIRFQFGNFSPHLTISLVASLVLPRTLFWYAYPAILIFALCFFSSLFLQLSRRLLNWVNNKLTALSVCERDHNQTEAELDIEAQAPLPQHGSVDQNSPEDSDSLAEPIDGIMVL